MSSPAACTMRTHHMSTFIEYYREPFEVNAFGYVVSSIRSWSSRCARPTCPSVCIQWSYQQLLISYANDTNCKYCFRMYSVSIGIHTLTHILPQNRFGFIICLQPLSHTSIFRSSSFSRSFGCIRSSFGCASDSIWIPDTKIRIDWNLFFDCLRLRINHWFWFRVGCLYNRWHHNLSKCKMHHFVNDKNGNVQSISTFIHSIKQQKNHIAEDCSLVYL